VRVLAIALSAALLATAHRAGAQDQDPTFRKVVPERRNGVVLGASGGLAFSGASGTPNDAKLLNDPGSYSESPILVGWSSSYFLMGALADWISFGPMLTIAGADTPSWKSTAVGGGVRVEIYPLVSFVPALADFGAFAHLGVGTAELQAKGPYPASDGAQSLFGAGVQHEWRLGRLLGGHAAAGPMVEYDAIRSTSTERHWLTMGLRLVWYGGHVALDDG
jgi:hypothetical protein